MSRLNGNVSPKINKHQNRILIATTLVCVYSMYLLFFQMVLTNPFNETTGKFKKYFSHKVMLPKRSGATQVDFSQFYKSADDCQGETDFNCGLISKNLVSHISYSPESSLVLLANPDQPDKVGKLYLQVRAILI